MENDKKIFNIIAPFTSLQELKNGIITVDSILNSYENDTKISEMEENDLKNIIFKLEKIALSCRNKLEESEKEIQFSKRNSLKNFPIFIQFQNNILKITTPNLLKSIPSKKENSQMAFMFANYVEAGLLKYEKQNQIKFSQLLQPPFVLIIVRKDVKFSVVGMCDNDNLETRKITNAITKVLKTSDSAANMDIICCFRYVTNLEDKGVDFILTEQSNVLSVLQKLYTFC